MTRFSQNVTSDCLWSLLQKFSTKYNMLWRVKFLSTLKGFIIEIIGRTVNFFLRTSSPQILRPGSHDQGTGFVLQPIIQVFLDDNAVDVTRWMVILTLNKCINAFQVIHLWNSFKPWRRKWPRYFISYLFTLNQWGIFMFLIDKEHRCTYNFEICVQCLYLHTIKESSYPEMRD